MCLRTMDLLNTYKLDNEKFLPSAKFVAHVKKISKTNTWCYYITQTAESEVHSQISAQYANIHFF